MTFVLPSAFQREEKG